MIRKLKESIRDLYHFDFGQKMPWSRNSMRGDCSGLWGDCTKLEGDCTELEGDCTGLRGDCSDLYGDCSGLSGDCTGLRGKCTGLLGDFDLCEITDDERKKGVHIYDLIFKSEEEK